MKAIQPAIFDHAGVTLFRLFEHVIKKWRAKRIPHVRHFAANQRRRRPAAGQHDAVRAQHPDIQLAIHKLVGTIEGCKRLVALLTIADDRPRQQRPGALHIAGHALMGHMSCRPFCPRDEQAQRQYRQQQHVDHQTQLHGATPFQCPATTATIILPRIPAGRYTGVSLAYASASHFMPLPPKLICNRASSPRPSVDTMTPMPNLACSTVCPTRRPPAAAGSA